MTAMTSTTEQDVARIAFVKTADRAEGVRRVMALLDPIEWAGKHVLIKPNFVAPFTHAATDFNLLAAIVRSVRASGGNPLIAESSGFEFDTEATFNILGAYEFAEKLGVPLINLDHEPKISVVLKGTANRTVRIPELVFTCDHIIDVPKLKRHSITRATIGVKNLFGLLSRESRRALHAWGLEQAIYQLGETIPIDLVVVDASVVTQRAVYGKRENLNLLIASKNVHACDIYCCRKLGVDYKRVEHIRRSAEKAPYRKNYCLVDGDNDNDISIGYSINELPMKNDEKLHAKIHRRVYQAMYFTDMVYTELTGRSSLIPKAHYYFGIRPEIDVRRCTACGDCLPACPVDAIEMPERVINAQRCMQVRCLQCIPRCPENALSIKGRDVDPTLSKEG
jgi:uncharacterized protein (DUF362 family)/NAD-dependent dihydropyrimidine dehydrogenase PreA subunit